MVNVNGRRPNTKSFGQTKQPTIPCPRCGGTGHIEPESITIGDRFKQLRSKMNLTQAEVAPKIGISRAQVANIEGDRSRPSIENFVRAADTFGTSVDYLLGRK